MADTVKLQYPVMADWEQRVGVPSLDELLAKRMELVRERAPLKALYGPAKLWDHKRKAMLCLVNMKLRAQAEANGEKIVETRLDVEAHTAPEYLDLLAQAAEGLARVDELDGMIFDLEMAIENRRQMISVYGKELGL